MNPARTLLVAAANAIAVLCFAVAGEVWWRETLIMTVAAAAGGYAGARLARRLDPNTIRAAVTLLTVVFFLRAL